MKPSCHREDAEAVVRRLRERGHVAYFAGGCVRDILMGLEPKDFDVATDAPPARVRESFSNTQAVGAAFGVILVHHRQSVVEVATFRTEGRYLDGRRPESVAFTDAEHDARRRDFTINGLFMDPESGEVIDYVGGQEDVKARRLRAIGNPDERFGEDHLRLLRAVRFAARFDLSIEPATAEAIRRHASRLVRISPERIADELRLMLTVPSRTAAWPMLWDFALVDQVFRFPGVSAEDVEFDRGRSLFLAVAPGRGIPFGLALATAAACYLMQARRSADVRSVAEPRQVHQIVRALREALKISNGESEEVAETLGSIGPLLREDPPGVATMKRFLAKPVAGGAWDLLEAVERVAGTNGRVAWLRERFTELSKGEVAPTPLVTGDDLTAAGYRPGPAFKHVLDALYDAQLEGRIGSTEEGMAMVGRLFDETPRSRR